jgi:uncharacterized membrane protein YedE/YeeE
MKYLNVLILGVVFGIILTKAQIISWFRIFEMFRFDSFHMYGVIGSAVVLGAIFVFLSKKLGWKSTAGQSLLVNTYAAGWKKYLLGGTLFGLGWAMTGACPGPLFMLVGKGHLMILVAIAAALLGTFVYGVVSKKLPR